MKFKESFMEKTDHSSTFENESKVRNVFTDVNTISSIPSGLFMLGIVVFVMSYMLSKSIVLTLILTIPYFVMMYTIHKDDVHGLKVWMACWGDKTVVWESGRSQELNFIVTKEGSK